VKLILLSGGSGKRLWPLSNDARSKQFLKVLENENGTMESMVQRVWRQLTRAGLSGDTLITTSKSQVEILQSQLDPSIRLIVEPERRDTFPAIALATAYLNSEEKTSLEETVIVLPVDPYVDDEYFEKIKELALALDLSGASLALLGVKPTYPSGKYGYIIPSENSSLYSRVSHFIEKPSESKAAELIQEAAMWNCGVFAFKLGHMMGILEERGLPCQFGDLLQQYGSLPKKSFDYEVVEKTARIVVVPYEGKWKDLGTWNTLTEEMGTSTLGRGLLGPGTQNTHIVNELDIPVAVVGISNAVIVAGPDGILVSDKSESPKIKDLNINFDSRPMYEERRWGWYRVLDFSKYDAREVLTRRICIYEGKNLSYQYHLQRTETWNVVNGTGVLVINGVRSNIGPGDVVQIRPGDKHAVHALTDLEIIEMQSGEQLLEEDVIRITLSWDVLMCDLSI
jgi:mannose-1-phosphate guanylyltransferase